MIEILGAVWFSNREGTIGIARVNTEYDGIKYFISKVHGRDEDEDKVYIAEWGSTFPKDVGDFLFKVDSLA